MSNRTIRRAAERAALKAARKSQRQALTAPAVISTVSAGNKAMAATASILTADDNAGERPSEFHSMLTEETLPSESKSTGPRTEAGKETSSRNAMKHGLCAVKTLILPNESITDYMILEGNWFQTYRVDPFADKDPIKSELIRTAARAEWFFKRAERNYSDVETALMAETPNMSDWTDEQHKKLSRVLRYRTANANILAKHRKDLEAHIKARAAEWAQHQKSRDNDERMSMARERLDVFRQKNKPFDLAEELENMKKKAIQLGFRQPDPEPASE